jgi:putative mRNA 3-end processing factor
MPAATDDLIVLRPQGLYCPAGDFYIDPWRKVDRAVITHAHADHARTGHAHYLCATAGAHVLQARLGRINLQTVAFGVAIQHNGVRLSLHPAGHVLGSAQVRIEHQGKVWVASGDYFLSPHGDQNPGCAAFEPVPCHCFITESTFGLPIYRWQAQAEVFDQINHWWQANAAEGRPSLMMAYSLGKAQRLLTGINPAIGPIAVHGSVAGINAAYEASGVRLPTTVPIDALSAADLARALVIGPPTATAPGHLLNQASRAFASGWMQLRSRRRSAGMDRGFVLSDHADWPGLLQAIAATGCERVIVTHGQEAALVRWLQESGVPAASFQKGHGDSAEAPV